MLFSRLIARVAQYHVLARQYIPLCQFFQLFLIFLVVCKQQKLKPELDWIGTWSFNYQTLIILSIRANSPIQNFQDWCIYKTREEKSRIMFIHFFIYKVDSDTYILHNLYMQISLSFSNKKNNIKNIFDYQKINYFKFMIK